MIKMKLDLGQNGKPLIFEKGGASGREGAAQIICGEDYSPLIPLRVITREAVVCGEHAVFEAKVGLRVLKTYQKSGEFMTTVYKINKVERWNDREFVAYLSVENRFAFGQWEEEPDTDKMLGAILAAQKKALCIRCRAAYYFKGRKQCQKQEQTSKDS